MAKHPNFATFSYRWYNQITQYIGKAGKAWSVKKIKFGQKIKKKITNCKHRKMLL